MKCDGKSLVCVLNPSEVEPTFVDEKTGEHRKFWNELCSQFKDGRCVKG